MANPYRNTGRAGSSSPAHILGTVPKIFKGLKKAYNAFSNTAKQYFRGGKPVNQQTTREIQPLITGNKIYGRKEIDEAFRNRFNREATRTTKMPEITTVTKNKSLTGGTSYGTDVTNFNRPDAVVKMRTSMNKSGQYPKSDICRAPADLR